MLEELSRSLRVIKASAVIWWNDWLVFATLNLCWVVCLVTLVLGPPATFALFRAAHMSVRGRDVDVRELFPLLRQDFLKSWGWALANLLLIAGVWLNLQFYIQFEANWALLLQWLTLFVGGFWFALQGYALPYFILQGTPSFLGALRNALFTALASPVYSLVLASFVGLLILAGSRFAFLFFLGLPCLVAVLGTYAVAERLDTFGVRRRTQNGERE